jgi:hypothetical protein
MAKAGRPKGSPNRNSALFRHAIDRQDFDLVEDLILSLKAMPHGAERFAAAQTLLRYMYSQLKDVEEIKERLAIADVQMTEDEINEALQ